MQPIPYDIECLDTAGHMIMENPEPVHGFTVINKMSWKNWFLFYTNLHPLSESLAAELWNAFRFTRKKKNEFFLCEGEVCRYAWYVKKAAGKVIMNAKNMK